MSDSLCLLTLGNCSGAGASSVGALDGGTPDAKGAQIASNVLYLQSATATLPGLVTTAAQTFAGAKTFNGQIIASGGIDLGTQTLQGTTAVIDFSNFDVLANGDGHFAGNLDVGNVTATGAKVLQILTDNTSVDDIPVISFYRDGSIETVLAQTTNGFQFAVNPASYSGADINSAAKLTVASNGDSNFVGNVNITGTSSTALSVSNSIAGNLTAQIINTNNSGGVGDSVLSVGVGGSSAGDARAVFYSNSEKAWGIGLDNSDSNKFKISEDGILGTSDRFVVQAGGNVGIGDTSPAALLTVGNGDLFQVGSNGSIVATSTLSSGVAFSFDTTDSNANGLLIDVQSTSNARSAFRVNTNNGATTGLVVQGSGRVGIANSAPAYLFTVGSGGGMFGVDSSGNLLFEGATVDANKFTVTVADPTANRTYTIPNSSATTDTFCLLTLANCGGGSGVTTVGAIDTQTKSANGAVISGSSIYLQTADASNPGLVSTAAQTYAGAKTFNGQIIASGGIDLGTQTLQGTTAVIDFTNFDVLANGNTTVGGTLSVTGLSAFTTLGSADSDTVLCRNTSTQLATCNSTFATTSNAFLQNGNSFGATAVLGTNDTNNLSFETDGTTRWTIDTNGHFTPNVDDTYDIGSDTNRVHDLYLGPSTLHIGSSSSDEGTLSYDTSTESLLVQNATDSTTALQVRTSGGTSVITVDTLNERLGIGDDTPSAALSVGSGSKFKVDTDGSVTGNNAVASDQGAAALEFIGSYSSSWSWASSDSTRTVNVASDIPSATSGDLIVLIVYMGRSGNYPPSTMAVPSGFNQHLNGRNSTGENGELIAVFTGSYTSSFSYNTYTNSNNRYALIVVRNADGATPVLSAVDDHNFTNTNPYPTVSAPVSGRTGLLITGVNYAINSSSDLGSFPKPGNINDVDTIAIPPAGGDNYVDAWTHYRLYDAPTGGTINPGAVGGTTQWERFFSMMVQSAPAVTTTEATARDNVNTVELTAIDATFNNNDVIRINNAGTDYYTRIVSGAGTTTLTVSPAVNYDANATVTKYDVQNIGAVNTDYTTLSNRFFQGYFLGGIVAGTGSLGTTYADGTIVTSSGGLQIQGDVNSSNAFSVNNSSGVSLLNIDTVSGTLTVNTTSTFNDDITVAANKSLTLTGGTTANRPGSPTEGMLFYDTDTNRLLTYTGGKWQATSGEYTIVAASDSPQAIKDAADYVADGEIGDGQATIDGDQIEINQALTAAAGGKVYLAQGTYVADATILIPNNTTLAGAGRGTLIELGDLDASDNLNSESVRYHTGLV